MVHQQAGSGGRRGAGAELGPRVHYHTFGCKANQYDTERMRQEAEARGARTVDGVAEAEVVVVNTCTVTNQADADARRFIRRVRRQRPGARVVVAGCSAALKAADYQAMQGVSHVVPGHDPVAVASGTVDGPGPGAPRDPRPRDTKE